MVAGPLTDDDFREDAKPLSDADFYRKFPTSPTGEIRKAPSLAVRAGEEAVRVGEFAAGEAVGASKGAEMGEAVAGPPGAAVGGLVGAAGGAGMMSTIGDSIMAYIHHKVYGTPIDVSKRTIAEDFLLNAGTSALGAASGKLLTGGIPAEAKAVGEAAQKAEVAKKGFTEDVTDAGQKKMESLAAQQEKGKQQVKDLAAVHRTQETKAVDKIDAIKTKQHDTTEAQRHKVATLEEQLPGHEARALAKVSPQAQMEAIQQTTGRTADDAAKAALPELESTAEGSAVAPSVETLARQGGVRGLYFNVRNKLGDFYSSQYEKLLGRFSKNEITETADLGTKAADWEAQYKAAGHDMPKPLRDLIERAHDLGHRTADEVDATKLSGDLRSAFSSWSQMKAPDKAGVTVGKMLGLKRDAQRLMVKSTDDRMRQAAEEIAEKANAALGHTGGLPDDVRQQLAGLNSQYADYKRMFPHADIRAMATARTPIEATDRIFGNMTLADRIISNAKGDELKTLQNGFGDWAQLHPNELLAKTPAEAVIKSRVYGKLFPGTPFADAGAITYVGATADNIAGTPQAAKAFDEAMRPHRQVIADMKQQMAQGQQQGQQQIQQMQQQLMQRMQQNQHQLTGLQRNLSTAWQQEHEKAIADGSKAVRDAGLKAAKELGGPVGERAKKLIDSANLTGGPQAAANAAMGFWIGMTPEQFVKTLGQDQPLIGGSEAGKYIGKQGFGFWMKRMATDPSVWPWIMGMGGAQMLMTGRPSWYLEMGTMGAPMLFRRVMSNAFVKGLKDPAMARALLSGSKAARLGIMGPLASTMFKAATDEVGSRMAQKISDVTMEPDDEGDEATP